MYLLNWTVTLGGTNCYESILENVGKIYGVKYGLRHLDSFGFECIGDMNNTMLEAMKVWYNWEGQNVAYEKLCGIKRRLVDADPHILSECERLLLTEECISIGVTTDAYYLPWTKEYNKQYRQHSFLLVGFDGEQFRGVDSIVTDKIVFLSPEVFYQNVTGVMFFSYNPDIITAHSSCDIIGFLKERSHSKGERHLSCLLEFIRALQIKKSPLHNLTGEVLEDSTLMFCLANIVWSRNMFAESLKNIQKESANQHLLGIIQLVSESYKMWNQVKYMIIKFLINSNGMSMEEICKVMLAILEKEKSVYASIECL